jgi:hypothetical protein
MKLRVSYHPLCLADESIPAVVVHRWLAQPVLSVLHRWLAQLVLLVLHRDDSNVLGCPPAVQPITGLRILNQPIDCLKKVLVLGQVDLVHLRGLHLLLQHLCVVNSNRYQLGVLEGVLDHLLCNIVERGAGFDLANSVHQMKMFMHAREIKFAYQSKKQLNFNLSTKLTQNIFVMTS